MSSSNREPAPGPRRGGRRQDQVRAHAAPLPAGGAGRARGRGGRAAVPEGRVHGVLRQGGQHAQDERIELVTVVITARVLVKYKSTAKLILTLQYMK